MHSSGLNFYEGCRDILFEGNYVQNVIAINRSAENLTFRNNVVDSQHRNAVSVAMWRLGPCRRAAHEEPHLREQHLHQREPRR